MRFCINLAPALGLLLLLAEGGVLALSLHPRADRFYRSYYVTQARGCWLHDAAIAGAEAELRAPRLQVAALSVPARCYLLAGGWSDVEHWGVWSVGSRAELDLPAWPGRRLTMTVIGYGADHRQSLEVTVDGGTAATFFIATKKILKLAVDVPPHRPGDVRVLIKIAHPAMPGPDDQRRLGVGLIALDWW